MNVDNSIFQAFRLQQPNRDNTELVIRSYVTGRTVSTIGEVNGVKGGRDCCGVL